MIAKDHCPVLISSCYNMLLGRSVPLRVTVLFGQSQAHYEQHFSRLFADLDCKLLAGASADFTNAEVKLSEDPLQIKWAGSSMDWSDAQRRAHDVCLRSALREANPSVSTATIDDIIKNSVRGCEVHYKRCVHRLARTSARIPADQAREFQKLANDLPNIKAEELEDKLHQLVDRFPGCKTMIEWFLQPGRRDMLFVHRLDTLANAAAWQKIDRSNNRGESQCGIFRRTSPKSVKLQLGDGLDSIIRVIRIFGAELLVAESGGATRHGLPRLLTGSKPKQKRNYRNDGRPGKPRRPRSVNPSAAGRPNAFQRLAAAAAASLQSPPRAPNTPAAQDAQVIVPIWKRMHRTYQVNLVLGCCAHSVELARLPQWHLVRKCRLQLQRPLNNRRSVHRTRQLKDASSCDTPECCGPGTITAVRWTPS